MATTKQPAKTPNAGSPGRSVTGKNVQDKSPHHVGAPAQGSSPGKHSGTPAPASTATNHGGVTNAAGRSVSAAPSAGWKGSGGKNPGQKSTGIAIKHPARKNGINAQSREYAQNV